MTRHKRRCINTILLHFLIVKKLYFIICSRTTIYESSMQYVNAFVDVRKLLLPVVCVYLMMIYDKNVVSDNFFIILFDAL